ncbi:unnamed protein product [Amoebophrya sp. A25]|nr:unnamed protein product [Amoebophrya sp. A25]|eukprot:GSA25T00006877001.1
MYVDVSILSTRKNMTFVGVGKEQYRLPSTADKKLQQPQQQAESKFEEDDEGLLDENEAQVSHEEQIKNNQKLLKTKFQKKIFKNSEAAANASRAH